MDISTWHPLTVHFPIAFLSLSSILGICLRFTSNKALSQFNLGLLILGCLGLLLSIYTGNKDEGHVARFICDPTQLKTHQNFAYYTLYIYLIYLCCSLLLFKIKHRIFKIIISGILVLTSFTGLCSLIYVGHLGASVVYNQAGGVNIPDENCEGF